MRIAAYILLSVACWFVAANQGQAQPALPGPGGGLLKAANSGLCVAVANGNTADGAPVTQQPCTGGAEQTWDTRAQRGGYAYVNRMSGKCLNVSGLNGVASLSAQGTQVFQWTCGGAANDTWTPQASSGGYQLVAQVSSMCLNINGASTAIGAGTIQWPCSGSPNNIFSSPAAAISGTSAQTAAIPIGTAAPLVAASSGLCLTLAGDASTNLTLLTQNTCTGRTAQNWTLTNSGYSGQYIIANSATGKCLDNNGPTKLEDGAAIMEWDCNSQASQQRWTVSGNALISVISGKCINVEGSSTAAGAAVTQRSCTGAANQIWGPIAPSASSNQTAIPIGTAAPLVAANSGLCLTLTGDASANLTLLTQNTCTGRAAQNWTLTSLGNTGQYVIANSATGKCLDNNGPTKLEDGAAIMEWDCNSQASQQRWTVSGNALVSVISGKCINVEGGSTAAGAAVTQRSCTGAANQSWSPTSFATTNAGSGTTGSGTTGVGTSGSGSNASAATPPGDAPPTGPLLLISLQSGKCINVNGGSTSPGLAMQQLTCVGGGNQTWTFVPAGGGYQIQGANGLCLAVQNGSTGNGYPIIQQNCGTQAGGLFTLNKLQKGYEIIATQSGQCFNINQASMDDGGQLIQWDCSTVNWEAFTLASAPVPSVWSAPTTIDTTPAAAAVLPNGKILMWSGDYPNSWNTDNNNWTYTTLYDPSTNTFVTSQIANTGHDMFCPGTNVLPDGRIVVAAGQTDTAVSIYDPSANTWSKSGAVNIARGYNASTTLSTGESFTLGGSYSGAVGGKTGEIWSPATGQWRVLSGVPETAASQVVTDTSGDDHMWLFATSNGNIFQAGPSQAMNWISTQGNGAVTSAGTRGDDLFAVNGNAIMYDVGKILKVGGSVLYHANPGSDLSYLIDITGGFGTTPVVAKLPVMPFARTFGNSVVLPSGEVVTIGGQTVAAAFTDPGSVMLPEIWSPKTQQVRLLNPMAVPRNYHSWASLMLDGRVVAGGGGLCGGGGSCPALHPDFELLTPPYLLDANGNPASRPVITAAPAAAPLGSTLTISTDRAASTFALVRMGAVTHSLNNDQRRVPLTPSVTSGTTYQFQLSSDAGVLLPGMWMLFAMDANGVPSVAKVVRIQ